MHHVQDLLRTHRTLIGLVLRLAIGPLLVIAICLAPNPEGLSVEGQRALAVLALCVCWWLLTPVALPVTALVGLALLPMLGVLDPADAFALFGNQAVFFVVGVFLIAGAMLHTGLSKRLALWTLRGTARSEDSLAAAVLLLSTGLCAVIVSHAVAALMLPIVTSVIVALDLGPRSHTARRLLLSMAWGTIIGSSLTLFSSARASLALTTYNQWSLDNAADLAPIGVLEFSAATLPVIAVLLVVTYFWLRWTLKPQGLELGPAVQRLDEQVRELGPIQGTELRALAVLFLLVPGLVLWGPQVGYGTVAVLFSVGLFVLRVLTWEEAEKSVKWGIVLLYGGAIAIGGALDKSGAMTWLVARALPETAMAPWMAMALVAALAMVLTEFVSNAAVVALALPAVLALCPALGLDPRAMTILVSVATGLAFSMPTSTPAMAMAVGTGYFVQTSKLIAKGAALSAVSLVVLIAVVSFVWPMMGLGVP